jgi:SAM-dependent methyltransferase
MSRQDHWEKVYASKPVDRLGWFAPHLATSVDWIEGIALPRDAAIIDIGCGASTLVDDLLGRGYRSITALDLSEQALNTVRRRLGQKADDVRWLHADITTMDLSNLHYDLWHDRAVFHFLTEVTDREAYLTRLSAALKRGGHALIGVFAPEAPPTCSGLPVERYDRQQLADEFGSEFELVRHLRELHVTPGGVEQMYQYCLFRKSR